MPNLIEVDERNHLTDKKFMYLSQFLNLKQPAILIALCFGFISTQCVTRPCVLLLVLQRASLVHNLI